VEKGNKEAELKELAAWKRNEEDDVRVESFEDLHELARQLVMSIKEAPPETRAKIKSAGENVVQKASDIEALITDIMTIEYKRKIDMEDRLDGFDTELSRLEKGISNQLEQAGGRDKKTGMVPTRLRLELKAGMEELVRLTGFIKLEHRKYSRVTAHLEDLHQRFNAVLEEQQRHLKSRKSQLEETTTQLKDIITEHTQTSLSHISSTHHNSLETMNRQLTETIVRMQNSTNEAVVGIREEAKTHLEKQDQYFRDKNREIQDNSDNMQKSFKDSIDMINKKSGEILEDLKRKLNGRHEIAYEELKKDLKENVTELGKEYSIMKDKLEAAVDRKIDSLKKNTESVSTRLERLTSGTIRDLKTAHLDLLEKQDTEFNRKSGVIDGSIAALEQTLSKKIDHFRETFNDLFEVYESGFKREEEELKDTIAGIQNTLTSKVDIFSKEFTGLQKRYQEGFAEHEAKLTVMMDNLKTTVIKDLNDAAQFLKDTPNSFFNSSEEKIAAMVSGHIERMDNVQEKLEQSLATMNDAVGKHMGDFKNRAGEVLSAEIETIKERVTETLSRRDMSEKLESLIKYVNDRLHLELTEDNALALIKRIEGEPPFSKLYRECALTLFNDLTTLNKDEWYWKYLFPIAKKLTASISSLHNRGGETIYQQSSTWESSSRGLRSIKKSDLRQIINDQHWWQIWEPLLRWNRFFKTYFREKLENVWITLDYSCSKILQVMETDLGYEIDPVAPMLSVPANRKNEPGISEIKESVTFYRELLPHIKDNGGIKMMTDTLNKNPEQELIIYVDQLGLLENGERIHESRVIYYSDLE
jgi:hypothetical protein